jgi:NAD(P)-dependent dehydrogenase (short-subunit alcohol dehydrogenase family)
MNSIYVPDLMVGKRILVTGASSGIGKAATLALAGGGAEVIISGRDKSRLAQTAAESAPGVCHVEPMALEDFDAISNWVRDIADRYGPFDGVFHAAGEAVIKPARLIKRKDYDVVFYPSLVAASALCSGLSKKGATKDGASIVLMSSVAGSAGRQGMSLYAASKAGIDGLARALAIEFAPRRIRVNSLAAGAVRTEMHSQIDSNNSAAAMADYEALHPLGFGEVRDVVNMVLYLLSDAGRWITGAVLAVDGGYTAK